MNIKIGINLFILEVDMKKPKTKIIITDNIPESVKKLKESLNKK
jgi:hypothetical protein